MKVCDFIAQYLKRKGITHFFGFQGGAVTPLIDSMVNEELIYLQNYHEQASGFAAEAYARITGKLGITIATNGPGATNLVTAIANAYLDSSPCLFITGQVNTTDIKSKNVRQNGFQEIDTVAICKPITKYAYTIKNTDEIQYQLEKAICIALSDRMGSVLLDFPLDILMSEINIDSQKSYQEKKHTFKIPQSQIEQVLQKLSSAKRPLILIGAGVRLANANKELEEFVQKTNIPTVTTLMGLDIYSPTNIGFSGLYGQTYANLAVLNADTLLILGSRLSKRQVGKKINQYAPNAQIIQVDIDSHELSHVITADIQIHSDIKTFLRIINECSFSMNFKEWEHKLNNWKHKYYQNTYVNTEGIDPVAIVKKISSIVPHNAIITTDVGQNQMWVAQGWELKKGQRILSSGGLGCMGFSLPASTGAQIADPSKAVIAFMGDGGLQMNIQELQTILHHKMPVKIIVFNNSSLGMIQEAQFKYLGQHYIGTKQGYSCPNLQKLAITYNLSYSKINGNLLDIDKALSSSNSELIEISLPQNPTRLLIRYDEADIYLHESKL